MSGLPGTNGTIDKKIVSTVDQSQCLSYWRSLAGLKSVLLIQLPILLQDTGVLL